MSQPVRACNGCANTTTNRPYRGSGMVLCDRCRDMGSLRSRLGAVETERDQLMRDLDAAQAHRRAETARAEALEQELGG